MRRHIPLAALVGLAVVAALVVGPGMHASGVLAEVGPRELGNAAPPVAAQIRGPVSEDVDGYRVAPRGDAVVSVPVALPAPDRGKTLLRVWAYGPAGVRTTAVLRAADGSERPLGRATTWLGQTFDVTQQARLGDVTLRVRAENSTDQPVLFLDRLAPVSAPNSVELTAAPWAVGLVVALFAAALLELAGRLRRHWLLVVLLAPAAALLWGAIDDKSYDPLGAEAAPTWAAATEASWLGLHDGLLWGSWQNLSALTVQLFHALTPIVGTAPSSARAASVLAALLALAGVYALAQRAAGRAGGVIAVLLALAAVAFRDAAVAGAALPVLVLAGALFAYALHACLAEATGPAIVMLGAAAALLALAEPTWLPGALVVVVIVAWACAAKPRRVQIAGLGLLAALVVGLPHLASTASQNDGRLFADVDSRAIAARNAEFVGRGHGAPTPAQLARDPLSGRHVSLAGYLFGDHSALQVAGGALAGGQDSITAFNETSRGAVLGTLAFLLAAAGALFVLALPRLRLLVLLTPLVAAPALFIAARTPADPAAAGAVMWPVMLASAAVLVHAGARLARPILEPHRARFDRLRARVRVARWSRAAAAPDRSQS